MVREQSYVSGDERVAADCFLSSLVPPGTHVTQLRQFPGADLPGEATQRSQHDRLSLNTPGFDDRQRPPSQPIF